jgi:hypothetical protein
MAVVLSDALPKPVGFSEVLGQDRASIVPVDSLTDGECCPASVLSTTINV